LAAAICCERGDGKSVISTGGGAGSDTTRAGARSVVRGGWKSNASWPSCSDESARSTALNDAPCSSSPATCLMTCRSANEYRPATGRTRPHFSR
jgi:hypothetical protein